MTLLYLKVYGLSLKSIIFPKNELLVIEIASVVVEIEDLKKIKSKKLILNNCQINSTIPASLFSKIGIFNVREQCNFTIINEEDVPHYEKVSTNCLIYICSGKFNTLKTYNVNTQENTFSRKKMSSFEISLTGKNYSKTIENVIEHGVSNNLETDSDSGVPTADQPKLMKIPKTLGNFSLSTNDKIYSSDYVKRLWIELLDLALDKKFNCEELYFSGNMISAKNTLTFDNVRSAIVNLNNIKIVSHVKLSVTKSTGKKVISDDMIIYHIGKSVATEFRGKNSRVIRRDNHDVSNKILKFKISNP